MFTPRGGSKYINIHRKIFPTPQGALLVLAVGDVHAEMFRIGLASSPPADQAEDHADRVTNPTEFFHAPRDPDNGRPPHSIMGRDAGWKGLLQAAADLQRLEQTAEAR